MDILGARRSIEQKLLMQSVGLMALVAVSGTIMGIVTGSSAVLLDGVFSFVDVVIKIMMLMTAKLVALLQILLTIFMYVVLIKVYSLT